MNTLFKVLKFNLNHALKQVSHLKASKSNKRRQYVFEEMRYLYLSANRQSLQAGFCFEKLLYMTLGIYNQYHWWYLSGWDIITSWKKVTLIVHD